MRIDDRIGYWLRSFWRRFLIKFISPAVDAALQEEIERLREERDNWRKETYK